MKCAVCECNIDKVYWIPFTVEKITGEKAVCHDCFVHDCSIRRTAR